jgi:hypothetical protein
MSRYSAAHIGFALFALWIAVIFIITSGITT